MPTYEYECEKCGLKFERRQPISASPLMQCPECRGKVRRLISGGASFIVKGGRQGEGHERSCSLETAGKTCCGRLERCGKPACREDE
jgi:putative FmdB family regulatory protein